MIVETVVSVVFAVLAWFGVVVFSGAIVFDLARAFKERTVEHLGWTFVCALILAGLIPLAILFSGGPR